MSSSTALATISAVQFLRVDSYVNLACLTFLAYDTCLGFSEELEHVWRARWTLPKFLYLFMRYYSLAHLLITFCVNIRTGLPENLYALSNLTYSVI
ncbi:hypothetical protein EW026_g2880 [Hermanssonia centrifuga]|uniref:DUF6533 domain-containing protein n=1 Tax=Hermanssonia centrifuga TaxID=98765 RepID=A0A4S4KLT9_9APHY|nr:hypothetical protein EW026_g2880 [Hermanssonia centrifuga]